MINATLSNLIEGIKRIDNRLADALRLIVAAISEIPETDSGKAYCDAIPTDGAKIRLNKKFLTVSGVSIIPISASAIFPTVTIYAETNITYIHVFLFDLAGNRVSADVYWVAYGATGR